MWKKSGAWFYREIPNFRRPTEVDAANYNGLYGTSPSFLTNTIMCNGGTTTPINNNGRRSRGAGDYSNLSNSERCSPITINNNRSGSAGLNRIQIENNLNHKRSTTNTPISKALGAMSMYRNNCLAPDNESINNAYFPLYNPTSQSRSCNDMLTSTPPQRQLPIPPDQQQR